MTIEVNGNGVIKVGGIKVQMSPATIAFYRGVAAGDEILTGLAENLNLKGLPYHQRLGVYWLQVGVRMAQDDSVVNEETEEKFVTGAALRQPQQHGFTLHIDTRDPWFGDPEAEDYAESAGPKLRSRLLEVAEFVKDGDMVTDQKITTPSPLQRIIGSFDWND